MTLPARTRCACHRPPDWFSPGGGPLGQYVHHCPSGDWVATRGPITEPEARAEWNDLFGDRP